MKKLSNLFWIYWINKYENNKYFHKFLLYFLIITTVMFIWILWLILPLIYLGIILQRIKIYTKICHKFNRIKMKNFFLYLFIKAIFIFIIFIIIIMLFTLVIFAIIYIGVYLEKKKTKIKVIKNPLSLEYQKEKLKKNNIISTSARLRK